MNPFSNHRSHGRYVRDEARRQILIFRQVVNPAAMYRPLDAHFDSFEILRGPYARDRDHVYFYDGRTDAKVLSDDPKSFEVLAEEQYARDEIHGYFAGNAVSRRGASFVALSSMLARDDVDVFCNGKPVDGADGSSFRISNERYACDDERVYFVGRDRIDAFPGSDAKTFEVCAADGGRDATHFYFENIMAPRSEHEVFDVVPENRLASVDLDPFPQARLVALAVRQLHREKASQDGAPIRFSFFDPRRFNRVGIYRQPTGSLVVTFDQPVRFIPKNTVYVYARYATLRLVVNATGVCEARSNPQDFSKFTQNEAVPSADQIALVERVLAALGLRREEIKNEIVELRDGDDEIRVDVFGSKTGDVYRFDKYTGRVERIGAARASEFVRDGIMEFL